MYVRYTLVWYAHMAILVHSTIHPVLIFVPELSIKGFYHYYHYIMAAQELINPFPLSNISPGEFQKAKTLRRSQSNPLSKGFTGHGGHDMISVDRSVESSVERSRDMSKKAPTSLKSIKTIQSSMTSTRASSSSMRRPQSAGPTAGK